MNGRGSEVAKANAKSCVCVPQVGVSDKPGNRIVAERPNQPNSLCGSDKRSGAAARKLDFLNFCSGSVTQPRNPRCLGGQCKLL
jgi:hypothetical protein